MKNVKEKLNYKQNMIRKNGKGKYDLTIPKPYDFLKEVKKGKSIRQQKLEEMLKEKEKEIIEVKSYKFKANDIPRTTSEPLFERIMTSKEQRRQDVRRNSMALTKQNEKPFSFYLRDKEKGTK